MSHLYFAAFSTRGMSQQEPENVPVTIEITIERSGGTVGVVTLNWNAMLNGKFLLGGSHLRKQ